MINSNTVVKTIKLDDEVHERLTKHGRFGDTFQDIIIRLLDSYEKVNPKK